jgi:hypothetical protein
MALRGWATQLKQALDASKVTGQTASAAAR